MLLDSNIVIYAAKPEHADLRQFIAENVPAVSVISKIEVLGFHKLTASEKLHFEEFFAESTVLPVTPDVVQQAIQLRQARKMSLGDALVAATALVHGRTLVTRNTKDFGWIPGFKLLDPLATS